MFKKRKEKKAQEANAARNERKNKFLLALEETQQIKDPAERIMGLMSLNAAIRNYLGVQRAKISKEVEGAGLKAMWGTYGSGAAAAAASIPLTGPVGLAACGVGMVLVGGSLVAGPMRRNAVKKRLEKGAAEHVEEMSALQGRIVSLIDEAVENNVGAIAASPHRDYLLFQPRISDVFAAASAKHVAENEKLVEEAKKLLAAVEAAKGTEAPAGQKEAPSLSKKPPRLIKPDNK